MGEKNQMGEKDSVGEKGKLFIISAPSGAGKTTLIKNVINCFKDLSYSVSHTTRPPRKNEQHGLDYFFISSKEFEEKIRLGHWLEWAKVHENYYGTSKNFITTSLENSKNLVLDIDVQGACQIMETGLNIVTVFIMPPSIKVLTQRLENRGTDSRKVIETRLKNAKIEMDRKDLYEYVVINDDLDQAKKALCKIFKDEMTQNIKRKT